MENNELKSLNEVILYIINDLEKTKNLVDIEPLVQRQSEENYPLYESFTKTVLGIRFQSKALTIEVEELAELTTEFKSLEKEVEDKSKFMTHLVTNIPKYMRESLHKLNTGDSDKENEMVEDPEDVPMNLKIKPRTHNLSAPPDKSLAAAHRIGKPPLIKFITGSEYDAVPSYMKGRMLLADVNQFIESFNTTAVEKYKIYNRSIIKGKFDSLRDKQFAYFEQDGDLKGQHFLTEADLKEFGNLNAGEKRFISMSSIMRHCQRIKQSRRGKVTRYILS